MNPKLIRPLFYTIAVVLALGTAYLILMWMDSFEPAKPSASPEAQAIVVVDKDARKLRSVSVTRTGGKSQQTFAATLTTGGDGRAFYDVMPKREGFAYQQTELAGLGMAVSQMRALSVVKESPAVDDLGQYGLASPAVQIQAAFDDGEVTLLVGNLTITGDAYYLIKSGDPKIYTVNKDVGDMLVRGADDYLDLQFLSDPEGMPVSDALVSRIKVSHGDFGYELTQLTPEEVEVADQSKPVFTVVSPAEAAGKLSDARIRDLVVYPIVDLTAEGVADSLPPGNKGLDIPYTVTVTVDGDRDYTIEVLDKSSDGFVYYKKADAPTILRAGAEHFAFLEKWW